MAKEELEKAKKALNKSKEKIKELAEQAVKGEEKEPEKDESLESEIEKPLTQQDWQEVKTEFKPQDELKASEVGLEQAVAPVQTPPKTKEEDKGTPYVKKESYTPQRAYETTGKDPVERRRDYDPAISDQGIANVAATRLEFEKVQATDIMKRRVQGVFDDRAPLGEEVTTYVERKQLEHEKLDREKKVGVKKLYQE